MKKNNKVQKKLIQDYLMHCGKKHQRIRSLIER